MTLDPVQQIGFACVLAGGLMFVLWLVQVARRDASIVDVGWAVSIGLIVLGYAPTTNGDVWRCGLLGALGSIWAFRLGGYLLINRVIGKPEDGRYQALRRRWGRRAHVYFLGFFQAQAVLAVVFSLPFLVCMLSARPLGSVADYVGGAVWLTALIGEALADVQLARFRANPNHRGQVCQVGLWRYSRHPNYFFEWLHWCAYPCFAFGTTWWWVTFVPPVLMLFFLFKVTGIPHTERQAVLSRGEAYRRYQRTTSVFIPWPPRKELA